MLKLTIKEANDLADQIDHGGGNSESLRAAANDVSNPGNGHSSIPGNNTRFNPQTLSDEDYLAGQRAQTEVEEGTDLECMICHDKFDHLLSGTCEVCWREWALSAKPKDWRTKRFKKLF